MADGKYQDSARYIFRVRGILNPDWATWFPEFTVTCDPGGHTVLCGEVVDQAALYGILGRVCDLGLTIISVERQRDE